MSTARMLIRGRRVGVGARGGACPVDSSSIRGARGLVEQAGCANDRGGWTLDELLVGTWEDVLGGRPTACPVCGGALRLSAERSRSEVARCECCGSELS